MIDLGISKLALIGAVALVVIGPEKLPRLARTLGTMLGKAQRYVADVKAEVNRSIELEDLKKMKDSVVDASQQIEQSIQTQAGDFEKTWAQATDTASSSGYSDVYTPVAEYRNPKKKWRLKQGATPNWYKARSGIRTHAQSGAARVARFRPQKQI